MAADPRADPTARAARIAALRAELDELEALDSEHCWPWDLIVVTAATAAHARAHARAIERGARLEGALRAGFVGVLDAPDPSPGRALGSGGATLNALAAAAEAYALRDASGAPPAGLLAARRTLVLHTSARGEQARGRRARRVAQRVRLGRGRERVQRRAARAERAPRRRVGRVEHADEARAQRALEPLSLIHI